MRLIFHINFVGQREAIMFINIFFYKSSTNYSRKYVEYWTQIKYFSSQYIFGQENYWKVGQSWIVLQVLRYLIGKIDKLSFDESAAKYYWHENFS